MSQKFNCAWGWQARPILTTEVHRQRNRHPGSPDRAQDAYAPGLDPALQTIGRGGAWGAGFGPREPHPVVGDENGASGDKIEREAGFAAARGP